MGVHDSLQISSVPQVTAMKKKKNTHDSVPHKEETRKERKKIYIQNYIIKKYPRLQYGSKQTPRRNIEKNNLLFSEPPPLPKRGEKHDVHVYVKKEPLNNITLTHGRSNVQNALLFAKA